MNGEEATVTLKNVRPFGTEGRLGDPSKEIPPSEEVYPVVVFRGSDVQDLSVLEDEPKQETQEPKREEEPKSLHDGPDIEIPPRRPPPRRVKQSDAFSGAVPDANFDFSKADIRQTQPSTEGTDNDLQRPQADPDEAPAYDKKKSFFDNISNSATEQRPQRGYNNGHRYRGRGRGNANGNYNRRADWS